MKPESAYAQTIREIAAKRGYIGTSVRGIEAYMRLTFGTLDALSPVEFEKEICKAAHDTDADPDLAEKLAKSYGL